MIYRCMAPCCSPEPGVSGAGRSRLFTIDMHCHTLCPQVEQLVAAHPRRRAESQMMVRTFGAESAAYNASVMIPNALPKLTQLEIRLADMNRMGVDVQVLSPAANQYYYWAEESLARDIVRVTNEHIASLCSRFPQRLEGLGTVALQHPHLAVEQLRHAVETLGLRGVEISTAVEGMELADARFEPFWAEAARLGCVVFIHPHGTWAADRLGHWYLSNVIGQPLETTVALSHLIFGGVLDRHPALRLLAAHGGGFLPFYLGRFEHAWRVRPESRTMRESPRAYLKRIWFDTVVYEPLALRNLIEEVGVSQLVVGTDYPYDMGSWDVAGLLSAVPGLDHAGRADIAAGNARRLLGLPVS
jgi:aminocarboxymuconate-semialdehyde decarboxylase